MKKLEIPPEKYAARRKLIGTQTEVAKMLSITRSTIAKREGGNAKITIEQWLALESLPVKDRR